MSTVTTWQTESTSSENTEKLGERLGRMLRGGEVIELQSDLGGGKTTLVRGIARGAGSRDLVTSPTFTISREYDTERFVIRHFDFYRLPEAGLIAAELAEDLHDPKSVVIVEWAHVVKSILPAERLSIDIKRTADDGRQLHFRYPKSLEYIVKGLKN